MATYQITGRDNEAAPLVAVNVASIDQEQQVVSEMTIVNALRSCIAAVPGVQSVVVRRFEQLITIV